MANEKLKFNLDDDDYYAISIAENTARRLIKTQNLDQSKVLILKKVLLAIEQLPDVTENCSYEFGLNYENGTDEFSENRYVIFKLTEEDFEISYGGSVYENGIGSDSLPELRYFVDIDGNRESDCDLVGLENSVNEYFNLGAEAYVYDELDEDT
jgi:hypothetical protein